MTKATGPSKLLIDYVKWHSLLYFSVNLTRLKLLQIFVNNQSIIISTHVSELYSTKKTVF